MAEVVKSYGQIFPDGHAIEVVRQTGHDAGLSLLQWNGESVQISDRLEIDGRVYGPPEVSPNFLRAISFPTETRPHGSSHKLVRDISKFISKFTGLSESHSRLTSFFVMSTWLFDIVGIAPRLTLAGWNDRAATRFLEILGCLCRHTVKLFNCTPSALLSMPFEFGLTVQIRQRELTQALQQFLGGSMRADQFVLRGGRFLNPFCAVVLHLERPFSDSASIATIEIPRWVFGHEIPLLDPVEKVALTTNFQAQLLNFRLTNLQVACKSDFDPPEMSSPLREIARSLGASCSKDPGLQQELVLHLRDLEAHAHVLTATGLEAVTAEAMLFLCHEKIGAKCIALRVSEIADAVRILNLGRDEFLSPSPRALGEILRSLGFVTTRIDRKGRGVLLYKDIWHRVHEVAMHFAVPSMREGKPGCEECLLARGTMANHALPKHDWN